MSRPPLQVCSPANLPLQHPAPPPAPVLPPSSRQPYWYGESINVLTELDLWTLLACDQLVALAAPPLDPPCPPFSLSTARRPCLRTSFGCQLDLWLLLEYNRPNELGQPFSLSRLPYAISTRRSDHHGRRRARRVDRQVSRLQRLGAEQVDLARRHWRRALACRLL
eukprot:364046-Chlamydomonas_euryale.AAC.7